MPSIVFEPPLSTQDDNKLNRMRKEVRVILGTEFFLYADDYLFLVDDAIRYKQILRAIRRDVTKPVYQRFRETIENVMNIMITIFGPPGSGKSIVGLTVACMLQYCYFQNDISSHLFLCFSDKEVNEALKQANPGDIVLQDERPVAHGQGVRITADSINNIRKAVRAKRINWIGITPNEMHDMVVNLKFETLGYNKKTEINRMLVRGGRNNSLIGVCYFKKFVPVDLYKEYEEKKMSNIDNLLEAGGAVTEQGKIEAENLQKDSKKLFDFIRKNKIPIDENPNKAKREMKALFSSAGISSPSTDYLRDLIEYVGLMLKMGQASLSQSDNDATAKEGDPRDADEPDAIETAIHRSPTTLSPTESHQNGFTFDLTAVFGKVGGADKENKIMQYQLSYAGNSPEKIYEMCNAKQKSMQSQPVSLDQIRKNIRFVSLVVTRELANAWEHHCFLEYKKMQGVKTVTMRKHMVDPDFVLEFESGVFVVINAKATSTKETKFTYPESQFQPELLKARELLSQGKSVKIFIHFYNTVQHFEYMYPIDINDPQPVIVEIPLAAGAAP